jgi:hypothetical protein
VYSNDVAEESSPLELRNISVELFQKKIKVLEDENRKLHEEATLVRSTADIFSIGQSDLCISIDQGILKGKYHCTIDLLFDWFGISCMTTDNFCFYLPNRLIQTRQTGGQWYSDTPPFSIPCIDVCLKARLRNVYTSSVVVIGTIAMGGCFTQL